MRVLSDIFALNSADCIDLAIKSYRSWILLKTPAFPKKFRFRRSYENSAVVISVTHKGERVSEIAIEASKLLRSALTVSFFGTAPALLIKLEVGVRGWQLRTPSEGVDGAVNGPRLERWLEFVLMRKARQLGKFRA
jgi:hypothetical protein